MPAMLACCLAVLGACTPARSGARGGLASEDPHAMVEVPGGTFAMGSPEGAGESQEHPRHRVTVGPFRLDRTLVTVSAYGACVRSGACTAAGNQQRGTPGARPGEDDFCNGARPDRADHPINCVDSSQAVAYCAWVGKRLPTEEEWEWAARGPDDRKYPWGTTEPSGQLCWHRLSGDDYRHALGTCPVGAYPSGDAASGAHDMAGNVWEWTSTPWAPAYDKPGDITARVVRGGGWRDSDPSVFRGASRNGSFETDRVINLGFRCAR
jgi:formylglycine-generating enzyme required for sulfatase activity